MWMPRMPRDGSSSAIDSPPQARRADAIEPYFFFAQSPNCLPSSSSCLPLMDCSVQNSRLSSFWIWIIASDGILRQRDAGMRVGGDQQRLEPGLVALLKLRVEVQQSVGAWSSGQPSMPHDAGTCFSSLAQYGLIEV